MWEPLLRRDIKDGSLYGSWEGSGGLGVLCLVEPPRNALDPASYLRAQRSSVKLFQQLQEYRASPLPVAVQEDFWRPVELYITGSSRRSLPQGYVDQGGYGIVEALSRSNNNRPRIVRLEDAPFLTQYKRLENAAIAFMSTSADFFQALAAGYKAVEAKSYSPALRKFKALSDAAKAGEVPWKNCIEGALETARSLKIEPSAASYRSLRLYERLAEIERAGMTEETVNRAKQALMEEIRARVEVSVIDKRAAVELCLYQILDRHRYDESHREGIEQFREILDEPVLPIVPEWILKSASELVTGMGGDALLDVIRIDPDDQGKPHKGQGELISRFLELATVLGIDLDEYAALKDYVYYANCHHRMMELAGYAVGHDLSAGIEELVRMNLDSLAASAAERELIRLDRTIKFLEELGRYHLVYDSGLRKVVLRLNVYELCDTLIRLGMSRPRDWQSRARTLDSGFEAIRDFYDRTLVRGKDLASGVTDCMKEEAADMGILWCEGYLLGVLTSWFKSHDVSYSAVFPKW